MKMEMFDGIAYGILVVGIFVAICIALGLWLNWTLNLKRENRNLLLLLRDRDENIRRYANALTEARRQGAEQSIAADRATIPEADSVMRFSTDDMSVGSAISFSQEFDTMLHEVAGSDMTIHRRNPNVWTGQERKPRTED